MTKLERCYLIWRRGFYEHDWRTNQEIRKDDHFPIILLPSFLFPSLFFSSKCQKSCFNAVWMEQGTSFVSFYKKMNGSIFVSGFLSCFLWVEYKNQNTIFFLFSFSFFFLGMQGKQILTYNCIALLWWREILELFIWEEKKDKVKVKKILPRIA